MSTSQVDYIIDYVAATVGKIEGIAAVFGAGQGVVDDPLRPGQKIEAAPSNPTVSLSAWVEAPNAPAVAYVSQWPITVELTWRFPIRLWFARGDLAAVRRQSLPFYDKFLSIFILDRLLGGAALRTELSMFQVGGDKNWSWLDVGLTVVERVTYA